jgi:threonyl-tRNA synthetase
MIEHYAGAFPFWLAPEQVRLATVADSLVPFATELKQKLVEAGVRVHLDDTGEKLGKKIREAAMSKVPWTIVIGDKEAAGGDFQVKVFGSENPLSINQADLISSIAEEAKLPV